MEPLTELSGGRALGADVPIAGAAAAVEETFVVTEDGAEVVAGAAAGAVA